MGESETCEFMALGSVVVVGGLHPALWQPQISSQKRLNLYSIFFIRTILFIKHVEQEREKQLGFERFCANGSKLRSFSRITGLHFATQSDPNFLL